MMTPNFDIEQAIEAANLAMHQVHGRPLTDIETLVLKGAWERDSYDQIAARNQYSTSYISQDIAPKLWKLLSEAVGDKVKKHSLREPLRRYWDTQPQAGTPSTGAGAKVAAVIKEAEAAPPRPEDNPDLPFPTYVRRPDIEDLCYSTLLNFPGTLVRIKAPKLTGKTALVSFVLNQLAAQGVRTANLSLRMADSESHFSNIDGFLRWFCFNLEQDLGLESQLDRYWNAELLGSKVSCTTYFEKYLLAQDEVPFVLCIDDVDLLFAHSSLYEDFFSLLRSWYEKARSRSQWKKLRLILAHSTETYIRLNINQSPFNVGLPVDLPEFTPAQAVELTQRTGWSATAEEVDHIMALVGGHPYLLEKTFTYLKSHPEVTLDQFLAVAPTQSGLYRNHLQELWHELRTHPDLEAVLRLVLNSPQPIAIDPTWAYQLQSMGLITLTGNLAQPACQLYHQYFLAHLQASAAETQPQTKT